MPVQARGRGVEAFKLNTLRRVLRPRYKVISMQHCEFNFTWSEFILLMLLRLGRMDKKVSLSLNKKHDGVQVKETFQMS